MINEYLIKLQESMRETHYITIECTEQAAIDTLLPLLDCLQHTAGPGHSFNIVVDPDDSEHRKEFFMDGDGSAHIRDIKHEIKKDA